MNRTAIAAVAALWTLAFAAEAQERPPWTLTTSERIAARVDGKAMAMRADASASKSRGGFVLDGSRNPELFLPSELMSFFLSDFIAGSASFRDRNRRSYDDAMQRLGWNPSEFWSDADAVSAAYLRLVQQGGAHNRSAEVSRQICSERVAVLNRLRAKYPRFDEFLYGTFAPRQSIVAAESTSADRLLWIEEGCR